MHHVNLAAQKCFNNLRPTAEHARLFYFEPLLLPELVLVRNQEWGGISNGQIANPNRSRGFSCKSIVKRAQKRRCSGGCKKRRQFENPPACMGDMISHD